MYEDSNKFLVYQNKSYEMVDALCKAKRMGDSSFDYSEFSRLSDSLEDTVSPYFPNRAFVFPDYEFDPNDFR